MQKKYRGNKGINLNWGWGEGRKVVGGRDDHWAKLQWEAPTTDAQYA